MLPKRINRPDYPSVFSPKVKLYILGIPLYFLSEQKRTIGLFRRFIQIAKSCQWPVYSGADADYFRKLAPYGWKIIEDAGIPVFIISSVPAIPERRYRKIADILFRLSMDSRIPVVSLHPGNPMRGDLPAKILIRKFTKYPGKLSIIPAKSGIDLVGDLASKHFGRKIRLTRRYLSAYDILAAKRVPAAEKGEMFLIHSISSAYFCGNRNILGNVIIRLIKWGYGGGRIFIKGPGMEGISTTVAGFLERISSFDPDEHYTLAVMVR